MKYYEKISKNNLIRGAKIAKSTYKMKCSLKFSKPVVLGRIMSLRPYNLSGQLQ